MYILEKLSSPGWEIKAESIDFPLMILEKQVCLYCRMTKLDYDSFMDEWWAKSDHGSNPFSTHYDDHEQDQFFPDHYDDMDPEEKINALLNTDCGAEYMFES